MCSLLKPFRSHPIRGIPTGKGDGVRRHVDFPNLVHRLHAQALGPVAFRFIQLVVRLHITCGMASYHLLVVWPHTSYVMA